MAATLPTLIDHLPDLFEFVRTLARQLDAGELRDGNQLRQHFRDFYTAERMQTIETVAPGWQAMAAYADGTTLNHITQVLIALQRLPEYRQASKQPQALMESCRRCCCTSR
jgi:hypothetical protein